MNKKGFTVVELMTTFVLVAIISTLLIRLVVTMKEVYIDGDIKTTLITKQSTMTDKIYKDLKSKDLTAIRKCTNYDSNCIEFVYSDSTKQFNINPNKKTITYDNYSIKLGRSSSFGEIVLDKYDSDIGSIINLRVPIKDRIVEGDFGINITHQISDVEFDDTIAFDSESSGSNKNVIVFPYTGSVTEFEAPVTGSYKLEVWGAQGGGSNISGNSNCGVGGLGGYSTGSVNLEAGTKLYIYVGGTGDAQPSTVSGTYLAQGGFNGGGTAYGSSSSDPASGGGGATDIRIGTDSLYSRVIVAGGGGGGGEDSEVGGYGGGTTGGGAQGGSYGGTQTSASGGAAFGAGAHTAYDGGGGGGGWYGGGAQGGSQTVPTSNNSNDTSGASGGSGYVYTSSTASNYPSGCLLNSNYYLTDASTIAGNESFSSPTGRNETGHSGNGYAKITFYGSLAKNENNYAVNKIVADDTVFGVAKKTQLTAFSKLNINVNDYVNWSSSNNSIATVDDDGLVTFKKTGTVTITAKSKDYDVSKTIELTAEDYTGIPSGNYTKGNSITYAGYSWKILKDNGDTTTLIYNQNGACYKIGAFGSTTSFTKGNNAYTVMDEFSNQTSIHNEIVKGGIIKDSETKTYARPPKKDELTFSFGGCGLWTMTPNNSNLLYYYLPTGFTYNRYSGSNPIERYNSGYWNYSYSSTSVPSKNTYYESYTTTSYDAVASPNSTSGYFSGSASKTYTSDEVAYVETSNSTGWNSSQTTTYSEPVEACNNGSVSDTRYYSPGTAYKLYYAVPGSDHCNNTYYNVIKVNSATLGFRPVITVKEK